MDNIIPLFFVGLVASCCGGLVYSAHQADQAAYARTYENMKHINDYDLLRDYCIHYDASIRNHPKCHEVFK